MNIAQAYADGVLALNTPRGDEDVAHVSDYGKCRYEVFGRTHGLPKVQRSMKTAARLQKGLHDEDFIVERILAGLDPAEGWQPILKKCVDDGTVGHLDLLLARVKCPKCEQWLLKESHPNLWLCKGPSHAANLFDFPDGAYERRYIEIKTTEWREVWEEVEGEFTPTGKPKKRKTFAPYEDGASRTHILQSAGYCEQLPRNPDGSYVPFCILQFDRRTNQVVQFPGNGEWYRTEDWLEEIFSEKRAVIEIAQPDYDPIANGIAIKNEDGLLVGDPPERWMCGYCDNALCAKNVNPDGLAIPL